ncbi:MAG: N-acetyltransferase [Labilithrix sp.]|nr:N-acetyltransferase [Labilithrix sp.]MCW5835681.1 N-acetyltransferase [Labilithrix sp.]
MAARVHPSSVVSDKAELGDGTQVWLFCQIRENVRIGKGCVLGKGIYVDSDVTIGDNVKIQNNASVYSGVTIEDGVFVGPHVCFTNDKIPRAVNPDMSLKGADDWAITPTLVKAGAALGANSTIVCGVTIGRWAMVASGSVVTKDVPDHALVMGNPARVRAWVCSCGKRVRLDEGERRGACACGRTLIKEPSADGEGDVVRVA